MARHKERGTKIPKGVGKVFTRLHGWIYRVSGGRIGGGGGDFGIAILTTTGAKTGKVRSSPLAVFEHRAGWVVVASFAGHDEHPGWYHNLSAKPEATLQPLKIY